MKAMNTSTGIMKANCACGANPMTIIGQPIMRTVCHCHFCQQYTGRDHSDFVIYRSNQVQLPPAEKARFRAFKQPAFVNRGTCTTCGGGAYEHVNLPLFPRMIIIPVPNHERIDLLPQPALHMFYHRRKTDVNDALPKYANPLNSEWQFVRRLVARLISGT